MSARRSAGCAAAILALSACDGPQSALAPAGRDAAVLAELFWWMLGGATVIWVGLNGLMFFAARLKRRIRSEREAEALIVGGGVVLPTLALAGLLSYALAEMPRQRAPGEGLVVKATGESWWWRVEYWPEGATAPVASANELRLPAGRRSELRLAAHGVIHSFWIPALGGKTDMIPGRETRMSLEPTRPGIWRGQCAEFCGESHAKMALAAVVMPPGEFALWLEKEAAPAASPRSEAAARGRDVFLREGCGGCHDIRGLAAEGAVGPDLTHLGGRETLAAGALPMTEAALARWIRDPGAIKPGARMPGYAHLADAELDALAAYLAGLE